MVLYCNCIASGIIHRYLYWGIMLIKRSDYSYTQHICLVLSFRFTHIVCIRTQTTLVLYKSQITSITHKLGAATTVQFGFKRLRNIIVKYYKYARLDILLKFARSCSVMEMKTLKTEEVLNSILYSLCMCACYFW